MLNEKQLKAYKKAYNVLVERYRKAEKYLDNNDIPMSEREKHIPEAIRLINKISKGIDVFRENGIEITEEQIFKGFTDI